MSSTILHKKSAVVNDNAPKLPAPPSIQYGEIAINYADNHETIAIKNSSDKIVEFKSKDYFEKIIVDNELVTSAALNKLSQECTRNIISITYDELLLKRDCHNLIPGQQYRITDYITTTTQQNTKCANHPFDIIVTADDFCTLNENARAIRREGDTYFAHSNLSVWKIKYCIDNDAKKFEWADLTGKGVIYFMVDEYNNECPYDFKNIMFYTEDYHGFKEGVFDEEYGNYKYTFSLIKSAGDFYYYYDATTYYSPNEEEFCICRNNTIKEMFNYGMMSLNYNIFYAYIGDDIFGNTLGYNCYNNTFGNGCNDNSFGDNCYDNTFGNNCTKNIFGYYCYDNTFGSNCSNNTFGNHCYGDTFGYNCYGNTFGYNCFYITFGNHCYDNSFGNDCERNTFGDSYRKNSFGNGCNDNSFGDNCENNSFGNDCYKNTFSGSCNDNSFGNGCNNNSFGYYCNYNSFGNGCNNNSFRTLGTTTSSLKDYCRYNHFDDGCNSVIIWNDETSSSSYYLQNVHVYRGFSSGNRYVDLNANYDIQIRNEIPQ